MREHNGFGRESKTAKSTEVIELADIRRRRLEKENPMRTLSDFELFFDQRLEGLELGLKELGEQILRNEEPLFDRHRYIQFRNSIIGKSVPVLRFSPDEQALYEKIYAFEREYYAKISKFKNSALRWKRKLEAACEKVILDKESYGPEVVKIQSYILFLESLAIGRLSEERMEDAPEHVKSIKAAFKRVKLGVRG